MNHVWAQCNIFVLEQGVRLRVIRTAPPASNPKVETVLPSLLPLVANCMVTDSLSFGLQEPASSWLLGHGSPPFDREATADRPDSLTQLEQEQWRKVST
jgi:hypothetical protein